MAETSGDLGAAPQNFLPDDRGGANDFVEDDGESFADTFFGEIGKDLTAVAGEIQTDVRFIEGAANTDLGVFHHLTGHQHRVFQEDRYF